MISIQNVPFSQYYIALKMAIVRLLQFCLKCLFAVRNVLRWKQQIIFLIIIEWITMMRFGKYLFECLSESILGRKEKYIYWLWPLSVEHRLIGNGKKLNFHFRYFSCSPFRTLFRQRVWILFHWIRWKVKKVSTIFSLPSDRIQIGIGGSNGIANANW